VVQGGDADFDLAWTPTGDRLLFSLPDGRLFFVLAGNNIALPTGATSDRCTGWPPAG
jgi:hypothetical protein